jgi:hypothetical protein
MMELGKMDFEIDEKWGGKSLISLISVVLLFSMFFDF